jgi:hypothetical protein
MKRNSEPTVQLNAEALHSELCAALMRALRGIDVASDLLHEQVKKIKLKSRYSEQTYLRLIGDPAHLCEVLRELGRGQLRKLCSFELAGDQDTGDEPERERVQRLLIEVVNHFDHLVALTTVFARKLDALDVRAKSNDPRLLFEAYSVYLGSLQSLCKGVHITLEDL